MRSRKFDGVLICSDFDGTFCPGSGRVPQANQRAVAYFTTHGGRFTIATGRALQTFLPHLSQAPVNAPLILSNGGQLYDSERREMLVEHLLPFEAGTDMEELIRAFPALSLEVYHGEDVYTWNANLWTRLHLQKVGTPAKNLPVLEMPQPWVKAILHGDHEELLPAQEYILAHWGDRYEAIFSTGHMLELAAKGVNKGSMALELSQRLKIKRENLYCVGDNQNDLAMLAVSAVPFAPANCTQEVKDAGAVLLPPCEKGTIAGLVLELDQRY